MLLYLLIYFLIYGNPNCASIRHWSIANVHLLVWNYAIWSNLLHLLFHPTINTHAWPVDCFRMCSVAEPKARTEGCRAIVYSIYVLSMLLLTYLVNQLDRFLLGIVTKPMSQALDYGDWACMRNESVKQNTVICNATSQQEYVSIFAVFSETFSLHFLLLQLYLTGLFFICSLPLTLE